MNNTRSARSLDAFNRTHGFMNMNKDILNCFFEESTELIGDLQTLGTSLKGVGIPDGTQSETLAEFAQKLNRLIGGTASVGFDAFAPLSRKTAMLAERCASIKKMTIRLLIVNLNKSDRSHVVL